MAERAKGKAKAKSAKGGKVKSRGRVATLPKQSKPKKRGVGDNSGDHKVPDEVYERHLSKINSTEKSMEKAKVEYDQAKGVHQSAYKSAKNDGCNIDAIRLARKLDKMDHGAVVIDYADVGRVLNLMKSPLGDTQLDLFGSMVSSPAKESPSLAGAHAGKNGERRDGNPFMPGTAEFQEYDASWLAEQKKIAGEMGEGSPSVN